MSTLFHQLFTNLRKSFSGKNLLVHAAAITGTIILVLSGFDWWWYGVSRDIPRSVVYLALAGGGLLPIVVPAMLFVVAFATKSVRTKLLAGLLGQSAFLGWLVSSFYKALTGRAHPLYGTVLTSDISRDFLFGLFRGGIFWGWPSSHTTVAFATMVALAVWYRKRPAVVTFALVWAFYVGLAVSISIHWFSDFFAGALIGTVIGLAVGRSFVAVDTTSKKA